MTDRYASLDDFLQIGNLRGRTPETIRSNYQNLRRFLTQKEIAWNTYLLFIRPETIEASVQWLSDRGVNYKRGLGTNIKTKRGRVLFLLHQSFGYWPGATKEQKIDAIHKAYVAIRKTPILLQMSEEKLRGDSWLYLALGSRTK